MLLLQIIQKSFKKSFKNRILTVVVNPKGLQGFHIVFFFLIKHL